MVCLRNICINTLHKGDNDDADDDADNNNNNNVVIIQIFFNVMSPFPLQIKIIKFNPFCMYFLATISA